MTLLVGCLASAENLYFKCTRTNGLAQCLPERLPRRPETGAVEGVPAEPAVPWVSQSTEEGQPLSGVQTVLFA